MIMFLQRKNEANNSDKCFSQSQNVITKLEKLLSPCERLK